jgi:hypothetical protein
MDQAPGCVMWLPGYEGGASSVWVECTCLLDPGMALHELRVVQSIEGGADFHGEASENDRYRFARNAGGTGALVVLTQNMRFEIARIEGIEFDDDGPTRDPRLLDIDLRGRLHTLDARLLGPERQPIRLRIVRIDDGMGHATSTVTTEDGWISVTVPREIESLHAKVEGYERAPFHDLEHVVLEPE